MKNNEKINYIHDFLTKNRLKLSIGESITGGKISAIITDFPGASDYFRGGIVSYTKIAKKKLLKVSAAKLRHLTAYNEEIAVLMALGARKVLGAHISVGVTGLAGPNRDNAPDGVEVGDVFFAIALNRHKVIKKKISFSGSREEIRNASALAAIDLLYECISSNEDLILRLYKRKWVKG